MTEPLKAELAVGVVVRAHGVRGHVRVRSLSGEAKHFLALREVTLVREGRQRLRVAVQEVSAGASHAVLLKLEGVDTPEQARQLVGCELWVDRGHAAPLGPGEYYLADLVGCRVIGARGPVGEVSAVIDAGAGDLLEIRAADGSSFLVPFRSPFVGEVDVGTATIRLTDDASPEGT